MGIIIQKNISLAKYTTFRIGGLAKFFAEVISEKELLETLNFAKENNLKIFILGGGSNVLISDDGFSGLVIRLKADSENDYWAGNSLASLVGLFKEKSLTNLEWATGIPGTIGGAVRGNAGAYGGCIADSIEGVRVLNLESREIVDYSNEDCQFDYRASIFKKNPQLIILAVRMMLEGGVREEIENKMKEIILKRNKKIPKGFSPGSFFKNPIVEDKELISQFEESTGQKCQEQKIPAGWLIDGVGLRGKRIGGVMISEEHANFIVNVGDGTAQDVIMLASIIKQKVREQFSVQLREEVMQIGF